MSASPSTDIKAMEWPAAQQAVLDGKKIRRMSWANESIVVFLTDGYLKIRQASGQLDALIVCEADLLAQDWVIVREH